MKKLLLLLAVSATMGCCGESDRVKEVRAEKAQEEKTKQDRRDEEARWEFVPDTTTIKAGDRVQIKGERFSSTMIIESISETGVATCLWWDIKEQIHREPLGLTVLEKPQIRQLKRN